MKTFNSMALNVAVMTVMSNKNLALKDSITDKPQYLLAPPMKTMKVQQQQPTLSRQQRRARERSDRKKSKG